MMYPVGAFIGPLQYSNHAITHKPVTESNEAYYIHANLTTYRLLLFCCTVHFKSHLLWLTNMK